MRFFICIFLAAFVAETQSAQTSAFEDFKAEIVDKYRGVVDENIKLRDEINDLKMQLFQSERMAQSQTNTLFAKEREYIDCVLAREEALAKLSKLEKEHRSFKPDASGASATPADDSPKQSTSDTNSSIPQDPAVEWQRDFLHMNQTIGGLGEVGSPCTISAALAKEWLETGCDADLALPPEFFEVFSTGTPFSWSLGADWRVHPADTSLAEGLATGQICVHIEIGGVVTFSSLQGAQRGVSILEDHRDHPAFLYLREGKPVRMSLVLVLFDTFGQRPYVAERGCLDVSKVHPEPERTAKIPPTALTPFLALSGFAEGSDSPHPLSRPQSPASIVFHVHTRCFTCEYMLPLFLHHYREAARVFVYLAPAEQATAETVRQAGRDVVFLDWLRPGEAHPDQHTNWSNTCWQKSVGEAHYVMLPDIDEFLHFPFFPSGDFRTPLFQMWGQRITRLVAEGYRMIEFDDAKLGAIRASDFPELVMNSSRGWLEPVTVYDKPVLFNPAAIVAPNYEQGQHSWTPEGGVTGPGSICYRLLLLHYQNAGALMTVAALRRRCEQLGPHFSFTAHYCHPTEDDVARQKAMYQALAHDLTTIMFPSEDCVALSAAAIDADKNRGVIWNLPNFRHIGTARARVNKTELDLIASSIRPLLKA